MNWNDIQHEYETTKSTLAKLAEKYDVPLGTIKSKKSRDEKNGNPWSRDGTKKVATKNEKVATKKKVVAQDEIIYLSESEDDGFTDKQRLFISYYVKSWNATKAYQKAYGCSRDVALTNGPRLLRNAHIKDEVVRVRDELSNNALLDKRTLLQKWIDIAFADVTDYLKFGRQEEIEYNNEGEPELDMNGNVKTYAFNYVHLNDSNDIDGALISEVKQGKDGITFKLADKMKALEYLSKHMDLLNENDRKRLQTEQARMNIDKTKADIAKVLSETKGSNNNHTSTVDLSGLTTEELRALAKRK